MSRKQIDQVRFASLIRGKVESARLRKDDVRPAWKAERKTRDRKLEKLLSVAVRTLGSKRTDVSTEELEDIGRKLPPAAGETKEHLETSRLLVQELSVELIKRLKRHPEDLKLLDGHVFEDLVAEILVKMGLRTFFCACKRNWAKLTYLASVETS
jgi:hypothetical protein